MENQKNQNLKEEVKQRMMDDAPIPVMSEELTDEGYSYDETEDAINQAPSPAASGLQPSMLENRVPQQAQVQQQAQPIQIDYSQTELDQIEELVESVVEEKWRSLIENFGDIGLWKDKLRTEISSIKQEIVRIENRLENLQKAVLGKVQSYDKNIIEIGSEIKALEGVFEKIIDPLTTNIKELNKITERLKK